MTFISYPSGASASASAAATGDGLKYLTRAGGITIASPDGVAGQPHLIVEAPHSPFASAQIDLSITTEQAIPIAAGGLYILDKIAVTLADGAPGTAAITIRTLDAARGGGRLVASGLSLATLTAPNVLVEAAVTLGVVLNAPWLYVTVSAPGTGTARVLVYGRVVALEDPDARTYLP